MSSSHPSVVTSKPARAAPWGRAVVVAPASGLVPLRPRRLDSVDQPRADRYEQGIGRKRDRLLLRVDALAVILDDQRIGHGERECGPTP